MTAAGTIVKPTGVPSRMKDPKGFPYFQLGAKRHHLGKLKKLMEEAKTRSAKHDARSRAVVKEITKLQWLNRKAREKEKQRSQNDVNQIIYTKRQQYQEKYEAEEEAAKEKATAEMKKMGEEEDALIASVREQRENLDAINDKIRVLRGELKVKKATFDPSDPNAEVPYLEMMHVMKEADLKAHQQKIQEWQEMRARKKKEEDDKKRRKKEEEEHEEVPHDSGELDVAG